MSKRYQCIDCGTIMSIASATHENLNPSSFVGPDGQPVGCAHCGSIKYRVLLEQLPEES